jgi:hypothetical protein
MNVLLVRPDGIGDGDLARSVATALRQVAQARVIFLSSQYAAPVPNISGRGYLTLWTLSAEPAGLLFGVGGCGDFLAFRRLMLAAWLARVDPGATVNMV